MARKRVLLDDRYALSDATCRKAKAYAVKALLKRAAAASETKRQEVKNGPHRRVFRLVLPEAIDHCDNLFWRPSTLLVVKGVKC